MLHVGLTGGIASGKSTVAAVWVGLGAVLIDSDALAREAVAPGTPGLAEVVDRFGSAVVTAAGELDRTALGSIVFGDPDARAALEAIVHPRVRERTAALAARAADTAVVVHDIPLLVELDRGGDYDVVVVVGASEPARIRRMVEDRGMSADAARQRIAAQADDRQRRAAADVWIANDGTVDELRAEAVRVWHDELLPRLQSTRDG